jgi:hypothetical protein
VGLLVALGVETLNSKIYLHVPINMFAVSAETW